MNTNSSADNRVLFHSEEISDNERRNTCRLALFILIVLIIFFIIF
jgi:hypothetical protein